MRTVDMKCPNCAGRLEVQGNNYICKFCGSSFAIDYDESDVEYERLKTVAEQEEKQRAHEKELLERKFELEQKAQIESEKREIRRERQRRAGSSAKRLISTMVTLAVMLGIGYFMYIFVVRFAYKGSGSSSGGAHLLATPTPAPNYHPVADDFKDAMDDFIKSGRNVQLGIDSCTDWNGTGGIHDFEKTDVKLVDAYLITDIPGVDEDESNRLVIIYEVTWYHEDDGEKICYDAVYFEGIRVNPNGGVISDFSGRTISRSDAAWGWMQAYSFEEYSQCYRENITALGGVVTKLDFVVGEVTVDVDPDDISDDSGDDEADSEDSDSDDEWDDSGEDYDEDE